MLGNRAEADGRTRDAALHLHAAEFFMLPDDPRTTPTRRRLTVMTLFGARGFRTDDISPQKRIAGCNRLCDSAQKPSRDVCTLYS